MIDRRSGIAACILLAAVLVACGRTVREPARPLIMVSRGIGPEQPMPVGTTISIGTGWSGFCHRYRPFPFDVKDSGETKVCDIKDYSVDIRCDGRCTITPQPETGVPPADGALHFESNQRTRVKDEVSWFSVRPLDDSLGLSITLRHGDTVYTEPMPRWVVFVPQDVIIACTQSGAPDDVPDGPPESCRHTFSTEKNVAISVRSPDQRPLGVVTLNGKRANSGNPFMLMELFPSRRRLPGDYTIDVVINRPPHEIRRQVTVRLE